MDIILILVKLFLHYFPLKGSCGVEEQPRETKTPPAAAAPQIWSLPLFCSSVLTWEPEALEHDGLPEPPGAAEALVSPRA